MSVSAQAQETQTLSNAAESIINTINTGYDAVGGLNEYANTGGVANDSVIDSSLLTQQQIDDYNNALTSMANASVAGAKQFLEAEYTTSKAELASSIDEFVNASSIMMQVVTVFERASTAETVGDKASLQQYIKNNDLSISNSVYQAYNSSLGRVRGASQQAAALYMAKNDTAYIDRLDLKKFDYTATTAVYMATSTSLAVTYAGQAELFNTGQQKTQLEVLGAGRSIYQNRGFYAGRN